MKPASFEYQRAENLEHACELLSEYGDDAKILAGGQSLIAAMNYRLARPAVLIDIGHIDGKNEVVVGKDGVRVKATTTQKIVENNERVIATLPVLTTAIGNIAHTQVRNRGTIGGSIVNADPASELPAISLLLDAEFTVKSRSATRTIPADEFFVTYMTTSLEPDEILTSILFKIPPSDSGWAFREIVRREGDYAMAGSSAVIDVGRNGKCCYSRLVVFGVAETPVRAIEVEEMLLGEKLSEALIKEASERIVELIDPEADVHASESYRKNAAVTLLSRSISDGLAKNELNKKRGEGE